MKFVVGQFLLVTTPSGRALVNTDYITDVQPLEQTLADQTGCKSRAWLDTVNPAGGTNAFVDIKESVEDLYQALDVYGVTRIE